jgi:hypothetical protein
LAQIVVKELVSAAFILWLKNVVLWVCESINQNVIQLCILLSIVLERPDAFEEASDSVSYSFVLRYLLKK